MGGGVTPIFLFPNERIASLQSLVSKQRQCVGFCTEVRIQDLLGVDPGFIQVRPKQGYPNRGRLTPVILFPNERRRRIYTLKWRTEQASSVAVQGFVPRYGSRTLLRGVKHWGIAYFLGHFGSDYEGRVHWLTATAVHAPLTPNVDNPNY